MTPEYAGKGKNSSKEARKPNQEKPTVLTRANALVGKPALEIAGKKDEIEPTNRSVGRSFSEYHFPKKNSSLAHCNGIPV
jgi:hypothetical protein